MKFFDVDKELEPLSRTYEKIKDYNRLVAEWPISETTWKWITENKDTHWECNPIMTNRDSLQKELKELSNAKWW